MTPQNEDWVKATAVDAEVGEHIFPRMAACEAALESRYGTSALAREANNLFGMKQHKHPIHGTLNLPTKEFLDGDWEIVEASWVKYDTLADCFEDRMDTLRRLSTEYPHYAAALTAADPRTYVTEVSKTWSTDQERAVHVIEIYDELFPDAPAGIDDAGTAT